jgi:hypothetical protein
MTARTRRSPAPPTTGAAHCGACGAPVLRQLVEVLAVVADATPIPPGTDHQIRGPNRLTWCAPPPRTGGPPRLRWIHRATHPPTCPHPHHADHHCGGRTTAPPPAVDTLF